MSIKKEPATSAELAETIIKMGLVVVGMAQPKNPQEVEDAIKLPVLLCKGIIDEYVERRLRESREATDEVLGRKP